MTGRAGAPTLGQAGRAPAARARALDTAPPVVCSKGVSARRARGPRAGFAAAGLKVSIAADSRKQHGDGGDPLILRARLDRPSLNGSVLARPRLIEALAAHADRPLSLVVAEAGYGKTVLLACHAARMRLPVAWLSLLASDADPIVFGSYLLDGLRREMPRQARGLRRALEEARGGGGISRFGTVLASALEERRGPPLLIVLDGFHEGAGEA